MSVQIKEGRFYVTRDGRKVGPMVPTSSDQWPWGDNPDWGISRHWKHDGMFGSRSLNDMDIVAEWVEPEILPVRTVTRHEIVPGEYGPVSVKRYDRDPADHIRVSLFNRDEMYRSLDAAELRAAARVFVSLAEALEQKP